MLESLLAIKHNTALVLGYFVFTSQVQKLCSQTSTVKPVLMLQTQQQSLDETFFSFFSWCDIEFPKKAGEKKSLNWSERLFSPTHLSRGYPRCWSLWPLRHPVTSTPHLLLHKVLQLTSDRLWKVFIKSFSQTFQNIISDSVYFTRFSNYSIIMFIFAVIVINHHVKYWHQFYTVTSHFIHLHLAI